MRRAARNRRIKKNRALFLLKLGLVLVLAVGAVAGLVSIRSIYGWAKWNYGSSFYRVEKAEGTDEWKGPQEPMNFICIGIDRGSNKGETGWCRSDVLIFVSADFKNKRAALVSIPRDTKVTIEGYGTEKINAAHAYYGPSGSIEAVKRLLGVEKIHYYVELDFESFRNIVNAIGGVSLHLDHEIRDPKVGCLPKGDVFLNGDSALILVRSRELPEGDLDRIKNQQKFLTAMAKRALETVRSYDDIRRVLNAVIPYLLTDIPGGDLIQMAEWMRGIKLEDIQMATIPGSAPTPKAGQPWYFIHDPAGTAALMENVIRYCTVTPPEGAAQEGTSETEVSKSQLPLVILNGAGKQGLAGKAADKLRALGYSPAVGNARNIYDKTTVYAASGYLNAASQVLRDLWGDRTAAVKEDEEITVANKAKVVVVLGRDYN